MKAKAGPAEANKASSWLVLAPFPLKEEITGSNPVCATNKSRLAMSVGAGAAAAAFSLGVAFSLSSRHRTGQLHFAGLEE